MRVSSIDWLFPLVIVVLCAVGALWSFRALDKLETALKANRAELDALSTNCAGKGGYLVEIAHGYVCAKLDVIR